MYGFSQRSMNRLGTCHPDLALLMIEALEDPACPCDMVVLEGHRSEERQNRLAAEGKSQLRWPNSRHNSYPSLAVDVAPYVDGAVSWDWAHYHPLAEHIKDTWARLVANERAGVGYSLSWGGDWQTFKDGPHWQLDPR